MSISRWLARNTAQGVYQALIAMLVISGGAALLKWLTGLPLHWAIVLALATSLVLAPIANIISLMVVRHRKRTSTETSNGSSAVTHGCQDTWLHEIAENQAKSLTEYIVTECWIIDDGFFQESPFIEFQIRFYSASVYKVSVTGIQGSIRFHDRQFQLSPEIAANSVDNLAIGEIGFLTIRQPLTPQDVAFILNWGSTFSFDRFFISAVAAPGIEEVVRLNPHCSPDNKELLKKYPKLEIAMQNVKATMINNLQTWNTGEPDGLVTMAVRLKNLRQSPIFADTCQLIVMIKNERCVFSPESGNIWEETYVTKNGDVVNTGKKLNNLADKLPARITQADVAGEIQFVLRGHGVAISRKVTYQLMVLDEFGEKHHSSGAVMTAGI